MRAVFFLCLLAVIFWTILFCPLIPNQFDFWISISIASVTLAILSLYINRNNLHSIFLFSKKQIIIGFISAVFLYIIFVIGNYISTALFPFAENQISAIYNNKSSNNILIGGLLLFLIGPAEEIFWRGFVQRKLTSRYYPSKAWILASLLYTAVHLPSGNFMLVLASLVCGLFWGYIFMKYKSIWPCIISHSLWGLTVFILFPF